MGLIQLGLLASNSGCDPSGAADCLAAINAAGVKLTGTGGVLYFGAGTYKVSAAITWPANVGIELGQGVSFTGAGAASVTAIATGRPTGPGVAGQFMQSNGPGALPTWAAAGGASATAITFDLATAITGWNALQNAGALGISQSAGTLGGNVTVGTSFAALYQAVITGIRFYWVSPGAGKNIKASIYDYHTGGTLLTTVTVPVTASGFYTALFAAPYTIPANRVGHTMFAAVYETTGGSHTACSGLPTSMYGNTNLIPAPFALANGIVATYEGTTDVRAPYSNYGAGDAYPGNNLSSTETYPVSIVTA